MYLFSVSLISLFARLTIVYKGPKIKIYLIAIHFLLISSPIDDIFLGETLKVISEGYGIEFPFFLSLSFLLPVGPLTVRKLGCF